MGEVIRIHTDEILKIVDRMDPQKALEEMVRVLEVLFARLGAEARAQFIWELMGESRDDKVSSLVHL